MNDTEHKKMLEQVMNDYYNEDGSLDCDLREYSNFKTKLSSQDKETVENYEEAADERKMASSLDYCADSILVCFEKNVSDDYIKNILENIAESVQIDNESIVIDEDLPDMEKIRIRAAQEKIDSKYVVVKLKKSYTTKRAIDCLDGIEGIRYVNLRHKLEDELVDINDEFVAQQWYLENINVSDAWEAVKSANKATTVKVAIIDSGIDINHSDLSPKILKNLSADVSGDNIVLLKNKTVPYYNSHGTNVAGAAGAVADNNIGIAGVAGITSKKMILNVRFLLCKR